MSEANDLLSRVNKDVKAKDAKAAGEYYTQLRVFPARRKLLGIASAGFYTFCFSLLVTSMVTKAPWMVTALPVVIAGLAFCLVPPTEDWAYKPWQSNTRQYEKHQIER